MARRSNAESLMTVIDGSRGYVEPMGPIEDIAISSVEYDSRKVQQGSLFVAVRGFASDGTDFIPSAVDRGASVLLVPRDRAQDVRNSFNSRIQVLSSDDTREALSAVSAAFYGRPSRDMKVIGITGTNGKTSITYMLESVFARAGYRTGVIGTVNYRWGSVRINASNTTPESKDLQELLCKMKNDGVEAVIMEISSHALELRRADHIDLDAAVFTNLTRDHLDFHKNFDDYFAAKLRIFDLLGKSPKSRKTGIVNADDEYGKRILEGRSGYSFPIVTFGIDGASDFRAIGGSILNRISGLHYTFAAPEGDEASLDLNLAGRFQLYNSLAAVAVSRSMSIPFEAIQAGLEAVRSVPGRFDVLHSNLGFSIIVDYAHTSDAMLKLLQSARELHSNRLVTVFGCGGDRDKTKRPIMGQIAEDLSDLAIVTSDNPRTEDPLAIIDDIRGGMTKENHRVIPDRKEAIGAAIRMAEKGDIIVIAGKGHEDYQIIGREKIHFDDRELAGRFIREREAQ